MDKAHQVEFVTTTNYIDRYLKPGMKILEVGAGTVDTLYIMQIKDMMFQH